MKFEPIPTDYKGYRFRSKTEARWAVFFTELGLSWVYEEQGFDMDGTWYLPDFSINDWNGYVEIKGREPSSEEVEKCKSLNKGSDRTVLLIYGQPYPKEYKVIVYNGKTLCEDGQFLQCRRCDGIWVAGDYSGLSLDTKAMSCEKCPDKYPVFSDQLQEAFAQARTFHFS